MAGVRKADEMLNEEGEADDGAQKKRRKDISQFFDTEAEEAGGSGDENEDGDLDGLIDDTGVESGKGSAQARSAFQRQLQEVEEDMAMRTGTGEASGAGRVYSSSFLDKMEERYKVLGEDELGPEEGSSKQGFSDPEGSNRAGRDGGSQRDGGNVHAGGSVLGEVAPPSPAFSVAAKKETNAYVVPDAKDPKLWAVKTFAPEKPICIFLMRKATEFMAAGKRVPIYSVFFSDHLRGYVYIEANKESDVREFVSGISGISKWNIMIVPASQMPMVFVASAVDADKRMLLKTGDWVRVKRGLYKGDLAQVEEVKDDTFVVKLKPRIQYGLEHMGKADKSEKDSRRRAQPRWFNRSDIETGGLVVNTEKRFTPKGYLTFFVVDGESYRDGFLFKSFRAHWFETGDAVRPLEHELQDWRFAPPVSENTRPLADLGKHDDTMLMPPPTTLPKKGIPVERTQLVEGDHIIVHSGDLKNLRGVITKVLFRASTVLVKPVDVAHIEGELNLAVSLLSKYFKEGDQVKVIAGQREGDTGYVIKVLLDKDGGWGYNAMARVLSTNLHVEYNVRLDHLQLTVQKAESQDTHGEFRVKQLVRLEGRQNSRGLVVRIEASSRAIVLTTDGTKHDVSFGDLEPVALPSRTRYKQTVWTLDRKGKKISPDCVVLCPRSLGRAAPIRAEVLYIHNEFCFLMATEGLTGDKAFLVCPGKKCELVYNFDRRKQEEQVAEKVEPGKVSYGVVMASETAWLKPWFQKMIGLEQDTKGLPKSLTVKGSSVRIYGGAYKGLRGEIREYLGSKVLISLLAKPKLVTVPVTMVAPDDEDTPREKRHPSAGAAPSTPMMTPMSPASPLGLEGDDTEAPNVWEPIDNKSSLGAMANIASEPHKTILDGSVKKSKLTAVDTAAYYTDSDTETQQGDVLPSRKRRRSRIPQGSSALFTGSSDTVSSPVTQSPSALFGTLESALPREMAEVRVTWLRVGLGVKYFKGDQLCKGWIIRVYADTALVVPQNEKVSTDPERTPLKGNETEAWTCDKRGDMVFVFAGPKKGIKGKVIGFENNTVFIRAEHSREGKHTLLFASASGRDIVSVDKKDAAKYSPEWAQAHEERQKQPEKQPEPEQEPQNEPKKETQKEPLKEPQKEPQKEPGNESEKESEKQPEKLQVQDQGIYDEDDDDEKDLAPTDNEGPLPAKLADNESQLPATYVDKIESHDAEAGQGIPEVPPT